MKEFLFSEKVSLWDCLFTASAILLAHHELYFDAIVVFLVGEIISVYAER